MLAELAARFRQSLDRRSSSATFCVFSEMSYWITFRSSDTSLRCFLSVLYVKEQIGNFPDLAPWHRIALVKVSNITYTCIIYMYFISASISLKSVVQYIT